MTVAIKKGGRVTFYWCNSVRFGIVQGVLPRTVTVVETANSRSPNAIRRIALDALLAIEGRTVSLNRYGMEV